MRRVNYIKLVLFGVVVAVTVHYWPKRGFMYKYKKVLHLALEGAVQSLDPVTVTSHYEVQLTGKVYEGLLEYHYLKRPYTLTPNLAEAMPAISKDGLTYTFTIKKGIYFQDNVCFGPNGKGREVTAADFVYSFKRMADPAHSSPYFEQFATIIKGFNDFYLHLQQCAGDYAYPIVGIQAIDRYTLQITLQKKCPLFLHYLTMPCVSVVAKEAADHYGMEFGNHPVGTGPFVLTQFSPLQHQFVMVRNSRFRDKFFPAEAAPQWKHLLAAAGKKLPFVDKIIYHMLPEAQPRWLEFQKGKIDCIRVNDVYINDIFDNHGIKKELQQKGISLLEEEHPGVSYIGFNCLKEPVCNAKLRQAMSLAFDRVEYSKKFLMGVPRGCPTFVPSSLLQDSTVNPYGSYDLDRAKQCLVEAGYPAGRGLPPLVVDTSSGRKSQCEFFAECMKQIGIKVVVEQHIFSALKNKWAKGESILAMLTWEADYADAAGILQILRYKDLGTGIIMEDQTFNQLYDQAIQMEDSPEKTAAYALLQERAMHYVPAVLRPSSPLYVLMHARVKNYVISPFNFNIEQYLNVVD